MKSFEMYFVAENFGSEVSMDEAMAAIEQVDSDLYTENKSISPEDFRFRSVKYGFGHDKFNGVDVNELDESDKHEYEIVRDVTYEKILEKIA